MVDAIASEQHELVCNQSLQVALDSFCPEGTDCRVCCDHTKACTCSPEPPPFLAAAYPTNSV